MSRLRTVVLFSLPLLLTGVGSAQAFEIFRAVMTEEQEVPVGSITGEGSSGLATFRLNDAGTQLTYDVQLSGLDMSLVKTTAPNVGLTPTPLPGGLANNVMFRMHIHEQFAGVNGPIVFGMIDQSLALLDDPQIVIDATNLHVTGTWDLNEGAPGFSLGGEIQKRALQDGGLYINVHTVDHAGGEVRGQIIPVVEPTSLALLGLGLLGIAGIRRRAA